MAYPLARMRSRSAGGPSGGAGRRLALLCLLLAPLGCAGVDARNYRLGNVIADRREHAEAAEGPSRASADVLSRYGLLEFARRDPAGAARALEDRLDERPGPDGALALAELSYRAGLTRQDDSPITALAWYRDGAALAALALSEPVCTRPELAVLIHNRSLARLIRVAQMDGIQEGRNWRQMMGEEGVALASSSPFLDPQRIADLRVTADLSVTGMDHVYRSEGLGVPLVAHRVIKASQPLDPPDRLLPRESQTGATAVLLPGGALRGGEWRRKPSTIVLFDPFGERSIDLGGRDVALACDRTTPLALQVARGHLSALGWTGLIESRFERPGVEAGVYMLRPYEPGKIPVVLVHGLVSSPMAFVQTINELRNMPELASRYQFWVFLYPTGLPIPVSAARLREDLARARDAVDPGHIDGALDQMVLVGHSMGGVLSKMMAQESGIDVWESVIRVPRDEFKAPPELRKKIDDVLVFRPLPFVRRVVFIATPHRGSPIANDLVGRVVSSLVQRPDAMARTVAEIKALNGPDAISPELHGRAPNSIGNLRTDSPILAALDRIPIDPRVTYHSILPQIGGVAGTDGVVEYRSSHLDGARSEMILEGTHFSQQKPEVTGELRRILMEHLATVEASRPTIASAPSPRVDGDVRGASIPKP